MKIAHLLSLSTLVVTLASCTVKQAPAPSSPDSSPGTGAVVNVEPATQPDAPATDPATPPAAPSEPTTPPASPAQPNVNTPPITKPPAAAPVPPPLPASAGAKCDDKGCAAPFTCAKYYGIAGPKGPELRSCEVSCAKKGATCPAAHECVTIADGPGKVCRPKPAATEAALPATAGAPCDEKGCAAPFTCTKYYGIAGPRGPEFASCEVPCTDKGANCPAGHSCTTISDGPGRVCRPKATK